MRIVAFFCQFGEGYEEVCGSGLNPNKQPSVIPCASESLFIVFTYILFVLIALAAKSGGSLF